jgi:hypothetical protein
MSKKNRPSAMEEEIRRRVEKRFDQRAEFFSHLIAYVVVNGFGWGLLAPKLEISPFFTTIGMGITLLWGMGVAIHGVMYLFEEGKERAIQREIERERELRYGPGGAGAGNPQKFKNNSRDRIMRLSNDGELIADEYEDDDEEVDYDQENAPRSGKL